MGWGTLLLIVLVLLAIGSVPAYPYSRGWGYAPLGGLGALVLIVIVLLFMGVIPISVGGTASTLDVDLPAVNIVDGD